MKPKGVLLDFGGTLVREVSIDLRAGNEWVLARASHRPTNATLEQVMRRANEVSEALSKRRDEFQIECPWPTQSRLIHDFLGIQFDEPMETLELGFWRASVASEPMPGARDALEQFHRHGIRAAVVSNCAFGEHVLRDEFARHGLLEHLAFIMVSAEYCVRKPHRLLFDTAAARLGVEAREVWFVGDRLDTDVVGAKAAGMRAIWLRPEGKEIPPVHDADVIADSWSDVVELLDD